MQSSWASSRRNVRRTEKSISISKRHRSASRSASCGTTRRAISITIRSLHLSRACAVLTRDAAVFYLAKMLYAGEDIKFIARRIMICAAEDVGLADPNALNVAVSASLAVERVGMPEAQIILAEAATYVACAPKSNSSYEAVFAAMKTVGSVRTSVPPHLQDAHYKGSAKLGHGEGYQYAHDYPNHYVEQQYLPDEILGSRFLHLGTNGYEQKIRENFKKIGKDIE